MLDQILQFFFPDRLDEFRHVRPDLEDVVVRPTPSRKQVYVPDIDNRVRVHTVTETDGGAVVEAWNPEDEEGRRMALTDADMDELAVRGLDDKDKVKVAATIKADVYRGKSRSDIVSKYRGVKHYSDGNIGKIMAALNAVRNNAPTPIENRD